MCSITDLAAAPVTVPRFARLVEHAREAIAAVSAALAEDPSLLAELPDDTLEATTLALHAAVDSASAAATVVTGRLERNVGSVRGKLLAGRHPSTSAFLEREAGLSPAQARAAVARGHDLDTHSTRVADAWLAGAITGGTVRDLTVGVSDVLRRSARVDTPVARGEALDLLLPVAASGGARRLASVVGELRLRIDPDGTAEEALFAFENQSLSIVEAAGSLWRISGWLTAESAIATRTVLEAGARQIAAEQLAGVEHDPDCDEVLSPGSACSCGELDRARRSAGLRHDQLLARALGEMMNDRLDDAGLGSHHRVAPHITVVADITDAAAPPLGRLPVPGSDDEVLVGDVTLDRLLCDSDVTRVLTTTRPVRGASAAVAADLTPVPTTNPSEGSAGPRDRTSGVPIDDASEAAFLDAVVTTLDVMARSVLYVGRSERTVSARLRRALEVRDGHCVFPDCRARVARCHAHHVLPWQHGGGTSLPNTALLCVTHHHAVHEGGWTMALRPGATGHEQGCWTFTPPEVRRRLRP